MTRLILIFISLTLIVKTVLPQGLPFEDEINRIDTLDGAELLNEVLLIYDSLVRINNHEIKEEITNRVFEITNEKDELSHAASLASKVRFGISDDFSLFDSAYNIASKNRHIELMIYVDEWQVKYYLEQGFYDKAMMILLRLRDLSKELGIDETHRHSLNMLGDIYYRAKLMEQAKLSYEEILQYYIHNNEWNFWRPYMLMNNLGQIALFNKDTTTAYSWYIKSLSIADTALKQSYRLNLIAYTKLKLAEIYRLQGKYNTVFSLITEVEGYPDGSVFEDVMQEFYYQKAMLFLERKQFNNALKLIEKLYPSDQFEFTEYRFVPEVYKLLADVYHGKKQYKNAFENLLKYTHLSDSIDKQGNIARSIILLTNKNHEDLKDENELEKHRLEIEQQKMIAVNEAEQKKQSIVLYSLLSGSLLLIIIILVILKSNLQRRKDNQILNKQKKKVQDYALELHIANITKDKFFSIIAHDLKGPVGTVDNLMQLLLDNYKKIDEDERLKILTSVAKSSHNSYSLLLNLLDWARSQQGKVKLNINKFNVSSCIESVYQIMEDSSIQKRQEIRILVPQDIEISTDKSMFETVMRNLISNSIKFTPVGGDILVSVKTLDNGIIISVKDSGIGMPVEMIHKLFDISSDIQRKGTDRELGTGLGLLLCKEFIDKMGGTINVKSTEGKGSEFTIELPSRE